MSSRDKDDKRGKELPRRKDVKPEKKKRPKAKDKDKEDRVIHEKVRDPKSDDEFDDTVVMPGASESDTETESRHRKPEKDKASTSGGKHSSHHHRHKKSSHGASRKREPFIEDAKNDIPPEGLTRSSHRAGRKREPFIDDPEYEILPPGHPRSSHVHHGHGNTGRWRLEPGDEYVRSSSTSANTFLNDRDRIIAAALSDTNNNWKPSY